MPTRKTLYEVLEVAQRASPETIDVAYKALSARLRERQNRDPDGAAIARTALEEAYRTLSNEPLRRRYDNDLAIGSHSPVSYEIDERSWITRNALWLIIAGAAAVAAYGYHGHVQKERAAAAKQLRENEERIARQEAEREEAQRRAADADELRKKRLEEARYQIWVDQTRRDSAAHARNMERERIRSDQEAARQQRMEELAKQREEAQARARLEQDKRHLRTLEQQNYGYRRY